MHNLCDDNRTHIWEGIPLTSGLNCPAQVTMTALHVLALRCKIDFAEQSNWVGVVDEMELATGVSLSTHLGLTRMAVAIVQAAHAFHS